MKLSKETVGLFKKFAGINSNIVLKPGSVIKTMAEAKNVLAKATVSETFPDQDVGIYDLNEFLGVAGMFDSPDFKFADDMNSVAIVEGKRSVKYFFSDTSILTFPTKDISMPKAEVTFSLSQDDLNALRKAASTLGVTDVVIFGEEGSDEAFVKVSDVKDATSNSFKIELADVSRRADPFSFVFNIGNFKLISGDYAVSVSSKLISHFKHQSMDLEYWIALEKNSTYGS
jgi:hypothetical protein